MRWAVKGGLGIAVACLAGCGRSIAFDCHLQVAPGTLDFGTVAPGAIARWPVTLTDEGNDACLVSDLALVPGSDPGFSFGVAVPAVLEIPAGGSVPLWLAFTGPADRPPYVRTGALSLQTGDPESPSAEVALTAELPKCTLEVTPASLDFPGVVLGTPKLAQVTVANRGAAACDVAGVAIASGSDPGFAVPASQPAAFSLAPGATSGIAVTFSIAASSPPETRNGRLEFATGDPDRPNASVPLSAAVPKCTLSVSPNPLDFGDVLLNASASRQITLVNGGDVACAVSGLALAAGSDPDFSLPPQPTAFTVAPGAQAGVTVAFDDASGAAPPLRRTGTLEFQTGDFAAPRASVPLAATVDTPCTAAGQWIYTVSNVDDMFSRFDPKTLTFTDIGPLNCPGTASTPFSMAVDQDAVAWVGFSDGQLFRVDTTTAACTATSFQPDQDGMLEFGMGFVFDPSTGIDTLFVAGGSAESAGPSTLATIAFPSLVLSPVGQLDVGWPELTGTGDGQLWGFVPSFVSATGISEMYRFDPASGAVLTTYPLPSLTTVGDFATKFWGGSFWIFLGPSIFEVDRATGAVTTAVQDSGRDIVGAGVSTCAPLN